MAMKTVVAIVALAALVATPAAARTKKSQARGAYASEPYGGAYGPYGNGCPRAYSPNPRWDVCSSAKAAQGGSPYVGSDPDPRVRSQLMWDPLQGGDR
jgi:hypothetical protein